MCGIAALLGMGDGSVTHRMLELQAHRGPDGLRVWSDEAHAVSLGHGRLAIVDRAGSDQPLHSDAGIVALVNGEIYNHRALRARLPYHGWRTQGDVEAVLAVHEAAVAAPLEAPSALPPDGARRIGWVRRTTSADHPGNPAERHVEWLRRLDGMFVIVLWDPRHRELVLARDALGIKPLVRTSTEAGHLVIASEAKSLRGHPDHVPRLDEAALVARLAFEYPLDATSLLAGVTQVAPGSVETWQLDASGRAVLTGLARWHVERRGPSAPWSADEQAAAMLQSVTRSVEDRLMADVPVGIVLSGGLDSSLIAAVSHRAAAAAGRPVPTCYTVAESEDNPDWRASEEVAAHLDLARVAEVMHQDAFWRTLPQLAWSGEDLDVTVLFFQPLFERMGRDVRVGLCGQGADELHAGYRRYGALSEHAALVERRLLGVEHPMADRLLMRHEDEFGPAPSGAGQPWYDLDLAPRDLYADLDTTLQFELDRGQLSNFQLRLVDRHSMAHGLEIRVPFLSASHRAQAQRLPAEQTLGPPEKAALRAAARLTELPASIVDRPKLAAGTATSPGLLAGLLDGLKDRLHEYRDRYARWGSLWHDQEELLIGLRLFESMHLTEGGVGRQHMDLLGLLDDADGRTMA